MVIHMNHRIKLLLHSLTAKWILITCMLVLPINILTAVIASLMSRSYQDNLISSYAGQLAIYGEQVDAELLRMRNIVRNFLDLSVLSKLNLGSMEDSVVEVTRFKNSLTGSNIWGSYPGLCYVWDKNKDIVSFFHQGASYSRSDMEQLERQLREKSMLGETYTEWEWIALEGRSFLMQSYDFPYFSFGLLLDGEGILRAFYHASGQDGSRICLTDGTGGLLACYSEDGFSLALENGEETLGQLQEDKKKLVLSRGFAEDSYQLAQVMERSEFMRSMPAMITIIYLLTAVSFISLPLVCVLAVKLVIDPLKRMVNAMERLESGDLERHLEGRGGSTELDFLYTRYNRMVDELNRLVMETYEQEIDKLQSDAINMRLQVNQHMLLNFLNTIYNLAQVGKTEQIGDFSQLLMKYFRYVLRQDMPLVTVKEEVEFVQDYLKIQKVRFPDCFTYVYSVDEGAKDLRIPQLLIQNFVENTVKYGLVIGTEIEIILNVRAQGDRLVISVCDTGNGMPGEVLEKLRAGEAIEDRTGKHIGIWNCRRRLKYYYGEDYRLEITSGSGAGTQVWIEIPGEVLERGEAARKIHLMSGVKEMNLKTRSKAE